MTALRSHDAVSGAREERSGSEVRFWAEYALLPGGPARDVAFTVSGESFSFAKGSSLHVENSHKYGPRGGRVLLLAGGWTPIAEWSDPADDFAEILGVAEPERFAP